MKTSGHLKAIGAAYLALGLCLGILVVLVITGASPEFLAARLISEKRPGALEAAAVAALFTMAGGVYYLRSRRSSRHFVTVLSIIAVVAMFFGVPFMILWLIPVVMLSRRKVVNSDA